MLNTVETFPKLFVKKREVAIQYQYLSVQVENKSDKFRSNMKGLFEVGLMYSLTGDPAGQTMTWIQIREFNSIPENPSFDFATN